MSKRKIVTQVGSLPHDEVGMAVEYSLRHDIPFLPELPKLGDAMLDYIENPGNLSCLDTFKKMVRGYETVKIQCVGPATLILSGYDQDEAISRACQHIDAVTNGLNAGEVILFLDEPALGQVGFDYQQLWSALFESFDVTPGVHVCGNMNWDELFRSEIEIISFDASQYDITKYPGYRNRKRIAWGTKTKEDVKDFQEGDLLTLPCGMGPKFYSVDDCEVNLNNLLEISTDFRPESETNIGTQQ
ncbi:MAG: uroporphyrinogen decarboxylase/cobalamine-independent methonine synthase family protein [Planctomycetota bacterium]|jgi:hypothetical protein